MGRNCRCFPGIDLRRTRPGGNPTDWQTNGLWRRAKSTISENAARRAKVRWHQIFARFFDMVRYRTLFLPCTLYGNLWVGSAFWMDSKTHIKPRALSGCHPLKYVGQKPFPRTVGGQTSSWCGGVVCTDCNPLETPARAVAVMGRTINVPSVSPAISLWTTIAGNRERWRGFNTHDPPLQT